MKVLLLTPTAFPATTGNAVTVERWRRGLAARGIEARVVATDGLAAAPRLEGEDVVHAYHAYKAGRLALELPARVPLVVSLPGTDLDHDLALPARRATIEAAIGRAGAVLTQGEATAARFRQLFPGREIDLIPKAFLWFGEAPFDLRAAAGCAAGDFLFFHPAGVRPVKGNLACLEAFARVHAARPAARVVFAGPALDADYAARFGAEVARASAFARWLPAIPIEAMRAAYAGADAVLNSSTSEGFSNVLLEAAAAGRPALASDIPGNRDAAALLYRQGDPEDFARKAIALVDDPALCSSLVDSGRARIARAPSPEAEVQALARAYERVL